MWLPVKKIENNKLKRLKRQSIKGMNWGQKELCKKVKKRWSHSTGGNHKMGSTKYLNLHWALRKNAEIAK
jgi:hypothetical protein